jgi:hypothetical protein
MFFVRVKDTALLPGARNDGQVVIGFLGNSRCCDFCQGIGIAFIAMTIVSFVINVPLVVVSLSNKQGRACTNGFPLVE